MRLSAHQPAYLPWLGYFDKIARSDVFVFMDSVQFERGSFINRNKIKTANGAVWLTIPINKKGHLENDILHTTIDESKKWRANHIKTIEQSYKRLKNFETNFGPVMSIIQNEESNLAEFCWHELLIWLRTFRIKTHIVRLSELSIKEKKSDLILELCNHFSANHYISGALGRGYLNERMFEECGVSIEYQDFKTPVYPQLWGEFVSELSALDYFLNCGIPSFGEHGFCQTGL